VVKVDWTDGAIVTVAIASFGGGGGARIGTAQVDLTDDRSYLSEAHRDLVEMLPNLSVNPDQLPDQGWIRVGAGDGACELHVLLRPLPPKSDLVLGRCAVELLAWA